MPWPSMEDISKFWADRPDTSYQWDPGTTFTAQKDPSSTYGGENLTNYGTPTTNPLTKEIIDGPPNMPITGNNFLDQLKGNNLLFIGALIGIFLIMRR